MIGKTYKKPNAARDALYERLAGEYAGMMARLARNAEYDEVRREDLIQDMQFGLWRSLEAFEGQCSEKTWVFRVAHNVCADHVRAERRRPRGPSECLEDIPALGALSEDIERRDARRRLDVWIAALDFPDRQIATLYLESLTAAEISDVIGLSSGAIATRLSRIKNKLTEAFDTSILETTK